MGITDDDLAAVATFRTAVPDGRSFQQVLAFAQPVRTVRVLPFLWSRTLVAVDGAGGVTARRDFDRDATYDRERAREAAARHGFRLPSEAEFEWVARHGGTAPFLNDSFRPLDATQSAALLAELEDDPDYDVFDDHSPVRDGPSRFGVGGLFCRQWLADDWHPSFEGAPDTSEPWLDGDPQGVRRGDGESTGVGFNWRHVAHETFHHLLAGLREPGGTPACGRRVADSSSACRSRSCRPVPRRGAGGRR
jgi:hypothetical protein